MPHIEFTDNYEDLSTDKGFQFKFHCERCGNGVMSSFQPNMIGVAGGLLEAAGSFFGGAFGRAADGAYDVQRAVGGKQHDQALREAVEECRSQFVQCRRCGNWVCREICFNQKHTLCKQCAPDAEQEETALRAEHVRTQVTNDLFEEENVRLSTKAKQVHAKCPKCGALSMGKKFCPECGAPQAVTPQNCPGCGVKLTPGAKFCGECGANVVR